MYAPSTKLALGGKFVSWGMYCLVAAADGPAASAAVTATTEMLDLNLIAVLLCSDDLIDHLTRGP
jgi:hypothetical protein